MAKERRRRERAQTSGTRCRSGGNGIQDNSDAVCGWSVAGCECIDCDSNAGRWNVDSRTGGVWRASLGGRWWSLVLATTTRKLRRQSRSECRPSETCRCDDGGWCRLPITRSKCLADRQKRAEEEKASGYNSRKMGCRRTRLLGRSWLSLPATQRFSRS